MKKPTRVNHPPDTTPPAGNYALVAPIYQSVKFEFDSVEETLRALRSERPGYFYSRTANPTTRQLELTLAELQGRHGLRGLRNGRRSGGADAVVAHQAGRSHAVLHRNLRPQPLSHPTHAGRNSA